MLARSACFNGNVLLNVGPRGDTIIPPGQASRLEAVGEWLGVAGIAVQDTRSVQLAERDVDGIAIGATQNGNYLYVHIFGVPTGMSITVELPDGLSDVTAARQLGGEVAEWSVEDGKLTALVPEWADSAVQVLALELPA